jgi:aminopeptidase YwaD
VDINSLDKTLIGEIWTSPDLYANVEALCDFGSRFAGTPSERQARDFILDRFADYGLQNAHLDPFTYMGWRRGTCQAQVISPRKLPLPSAQSLVYSPSTPEGGLRTEVIDVGAGTKEEFAAQQAEIAGKIVLASSASSPEGQRIHRREKYGRAVAASAVGFLFANHLPGMLAPTGSLRSARVAEVPGLGLSYEDGSALARHCRQGQAVIELHVHNEAGPTEAWHVVGEVPGSKAGTAEEEIIVIGGHYDGHDIAQGAMDNASGVAVVLELARTFGPLRGQLPRTLRFIAFAVEELGVVGSTEYVKKHREDLGPVSLMVNLDACVGSSPAELVLNGFEELRPLLQGFAAGMRYQLGLKQRVVTASDNFPFVMQGIPAINLVRRGVDPRLGRGYGHTAADTFDKVSEVALRESAMVAARLLLRAASHRGPLARRRTQDEMRDILIGQGLEEPLKAQDKWPFHPVNE